MTKPVDEKVLVSFYERVKPGGRLWKPISYKMPHVKPQFKFKDLLICWISGVVMVYMALFGMGKLLFGQHLLALVYFAIAAVGAYIISVNIRRDAKAILPEA
jgi:solute:Na+ symporter, SSS family